VHHRRYYPLQQVRRVQHQVVGFPVEFQQLNRQQTPVQHPLVALVASQVLIPVCNHHLVPHHAHRFTYALLATLHLTDTLNVVYISCTYFLRSVHLHNFNPGTICPAGTFSPTPDSKVCTICPPGQASAAGALLCNNISVSFASGFILMFIAIIIWAIYILYGRFNRVAFVRKNRVADVLRDRANDIVEAFVAFDFKSKRVILLLDSDVNSENIAMERHWFSPRCYAIVEKIYISLKILFFVLTVVLVAVISYCTGLVNILFASMIAWRGLNFQLDILFIDKITALFKCFDSIVHGLSYIFYPCLKALQGLVNFHINLSGIQVTCQGAQAPIRLLIDFFILGFTVVFIQSEYQELQSVTLQSACSKVLSRMSNPSFQKIVLGQKYSSIVSRFISFVYYTRRVVFAAFVDALLSLDIFRYIIQYMMSQVELAPYILTSTGFHSVSPSCDTALAHADTTLALMSTVLLYLALYPSIYALSEVVVPRILNLSSDERNAKINLDSESDGPLISRQTRKEYVSVTHVSKDSVESTLGDTRLNTEAPMNIATEKFKQLRLISFFKSFSFLSVDLYAAIFMNAYLNNSLKYLNDAILSADSTIRELKSKILVNPGDSVNPEVALIDESLRSQRTLRDERSTYEFLYASYSMDVTVYQILSSDVKIMDKEHPQQAVYELKKDRVVILSHDPEPCLENDLAG